MHLVAIFPSKMLKIEVCYYVHSFYYNESVAKHTNYQTQQVVKTVREIVVVVLMFGIHEHFVTGILLLCKTPAPWSMCTVDETMCFFVKVFCSTCCNVKAKLRYLGNKEARVCSQCHVGLIRGELL